MLLKLCFTYLITYCATDYVHKHTHTHTHTHTYTHPHGHSNGRFQFHIYFSKKPYAKRYVRSHLGVQYTLRVSAETRVSWCRRNGRGQHLPRGSDFQLATRRDVRLSLAARLPVKRPRLFRPRARRRSACLPLQPRSNDCLVMTWSGDCATAALLRSIYRSAL